jgi:hypothetical protein
VDRNRSRFSPRAQWKTLWHFDVPLGRPSSHRLKGSRYPRSVCVLGEHFRVRVIATSYEFVQKLIMV